MSYIKLAAHRGVAGANIPCNSLQAFTVALRQGADIVELDVENSADGVLFIQHPGMEPVHLRMQDSIRSYPSDMVERFKLSNCDLLPTDQSIVRLEDALKLLKGKCIVNIDKFWRNPGPITEMVRALGMENEVIIKCSLREDRLAEVEKYAPDLPFMSVASEVDKTEEMIRGKKINWIGTEVLFGTEDAPVAGAAYIEKMKAGGRLVWVNALVYNYKTVLAAGHNDDISMVEDEQKGWGWLARRGFDIIQTDFLLPCKQFLEKEGFR